MKKNDTWGEKRTNKKALYLKRQRSTMTRLLIGRKHFRSTLCTASPILLSHKS